MRDARGTGAVTRDLGYDRKFRRGSCCDERQSIRPLARRGANEQRKRSLTLRRVSIEHGLVLRVHWVGLEEVNRLEWDSSRTEIGCWTCSFFATTHHRQMTQRKTRTWEMGGLKGGSRWSMNAESIAELPNRSTAEHSRARKHVRHSVMYPTLYGVWVYVTGELFEHVRTWRGTFRTEGVFQKFFSAGRKVLLPVPVLEHVST